MKRHCITCHADITSKRIDARFCSDACRKYFKRNGSRMEIRVSDVTPQAPPAPQSPDKAGLVRTPAVSVTSRLPAHSAVFSQVYKKSGDLFLALLGGAAVIGGDYLANKVAPPPNPAPKALPAPNEKPSSTKTPEIPLKPLTLRSAGELAGVEAEPTVPLPEEWREFLGDLTHPFKMLVYGLPGSGKSTFALRFLDVLNEQEPTIYVSGEEGIGSPTLRSRIARVMQQPNRTLVLPRLPATFAEWKQTAMAGDELRRTIVTDSLTSLGLTPYHLVEELDRYRSTGSAGFETWFMSILIESMLSQVWIAHAYKDGSTYKGDATWAHDADIVIQCEAGAATTIKNRFGEARRVLQIFGR